MSEEQVKVRKLYDLIGERGLYVNRGYDVFDGDKKDVSVGAKYTLPLIGAKTRAYASPLLFATLTSLLNHGTMLINGAPGIGKTTGAEFAGHFFYGVPIEDVLACEIQGHPQQTREDMVAAYEIAKLMQGKKRVIPTGFFNCPVKIIDEANRMPADLLSVIMRLVDTGHAVYGGEVLRARKGPLFVTANYADEGTFQPTPPFLDRFDVAVMVSSPPFFDLDRIRNRTDEKLNGGLDELLAIPEGLALNMDKIRNEIRQLPEEDTANMPGLSFFADFVYASIRYCEAASNDLVRCTKGNAWQLSQDNLSGGHFVKESCTLTNNELSIRTVRAMNRYARAYAWFCGRESVGASDLKIVLPYLLWHKLTPTSKAMTDNGSFANDRIGFVKHLINSIEGEFTQVCNTKAVIDYRIALNAIRTGKIGDNNASSEEIETLVTNAITAMGSVDLPCVLSLASHVAAEYNDRVMREDGKQ